MGRKAQLDADAAVGLCFVRRLGGTIHLDDFKTDQFTFKTMVLGFNQLFVGTKPWFLNSLF